MDLSGKILPLRKSRGMSQEALAERLGVSRQTVSRWETGSAAPDAENLLGLSRLFGVSADELLGSGRGPAPPDAPPQREGNSGQILFFLVGLEVMIVLIQFMTTCILESPFFGLLSTVPLAALLGGFEYAYRKKRAEGHSAAAARFRKRLYRISAWLGTYFPIRALLTAAAGIWPLFGDPVVFACVTAVLYLTTALLITLSIEKEPSARR